MDQQKNLIDRIQYQKIKKFSFDQMQSFLISIYASGHEDATKEAEPLEKAIKELLRKEFHIGEKRYSEASMG